MQMYPALKAYMGDWDYYIVKMRMREVAQEVMFAGEIHQDRTLDDAIQRVLDEKRVKTSIVEYLKRRDDRFFSSLVVAALGGKPTFYPVEITDDPRFKIFSDQGMDESFGVITFKGDQRYYALDGQHRLKAIKSVLDRADDASQGMPEDFGEEEISVILIIRQPDEDDKEFMKKYRRLFSSLNRYAKPTDKDTNIIMDEDDIFAILTRRLITEHSFFQAPGDDKDSFKIKTKGKQITSGQSFFTSLQTLYTMNLMILSAAWRLERGWGSGSAKVEDLRQFIQFRPDEEYIDAMFLELCEYWDGILDAIPQLHLDPAKHRVHTSEPTAGDYSDLLVMWPIGQEVLMKCIRSALDEGLPDPRKPTKEKVSEVVSPLASIDWELHRSPWRHLVLIGDGSAEFAWKMRSEDRKQALSIAQSLIMLKAGYLTLNDEALGRLKEEWRTMLMPALQEEDSDQLWLDFVEG